MLKKTVYAAALSALIGVGLVGTFPAFAQEPATDTTSHHMADTMMGEDHGSMTNEDHASMANMMGEDHGSMTTDDQDAMAARMHATMETNGSFMDRSGR